MREEVESSEEMVRLNFVFSQRCIRIRCTTSQGIKPESPQILCNSENPGGSDLILICWAPKDTIFPAILVTCAVQLVFIQVKVVVPMCYTTQVGMLMIRENNE